MGVDAKTAQLRGEIADAGRSPQRVQSAPARLGIMAAAVTGAVVGCAIASPYTPDVKPGAGAAVSLRGEADPGGNSGWYFMVDVYDFQSGCPEIGSRMRSSGYRGSVPAPRGSNRTFTVPAVGRVVLRGSWRRDSFERASCGAVLVFTPDATAHYVYAFSSPSETNPRCGATLLEVGADGASLEEPETPVSYPRTMHSAAGFEAPELCTLTASAQASARPEAEAQRQRAPRPGTEIVVGLGYTVGGDDLLQVMFDNGEEQTLSAGQGVYGTVGGTVTPLWIRETLGFGLGADIGWQIDSVDASNGDVSFSRFPVLTRAQALSRVGGRWWLYAEAGARKDLRVKLSVDDSVSGLPDVSFESPLGWMAGAGLYFSASRHLTLSFGLRYTEMEYRIGGANIDASNIGFGMTMGFSP